MIATFINLVELELSHQMANHNWPQDFGHFDNGMDPLHLTTTEADRSLYYQPHKPATTNHAPSWSMDHSSAYNIGITQGLTSAQMEPSYSASSAASSQQQAVSRRPSEAEAARTSSQFNDLLQQYQPGTAEYNQVLMAFNPWYESYQNGSNIQSSTTKENSPNPDSDDDDNATQFSMDTPAGSVISRVVHVTGKDGKTRRVFQCPNCTHQPARKADLSRHFNSMHLKDVDRLLECPEAGCARTGHRGFTRKDHLVEHLRSFHHQEEVYPKKARKEKKGESTRRAN